ncbi:hypothetical protein VULLAG_LOCUS11688 [Vulpes lagopus]
MGATAAGAQAQRGTGGAGGAEGPRAARTAQRALAHVTHGERRGGRACLPGAPVRRRAPRTGPPGGGAAATVRRPRRPPLQPRGVRRALGLAGPREKFC